MSKFILALSLLLITSKISVAQCDQKVKWYGSKIEMVDGEGSVVRVRDFSFIITVSSPKVFLEIVDDPDDNVEGVIDSTFCQWKEPFKNGKVVIKTTFVKKSGDSLPAILTVEGQEGKLLARVELNDPSSGETRRFKLYLDRYEISE